MPLSTSSTLDNSPPTAGAERPPWRYDPRMADLNQMAYRVMQHATEPQPEKSVYQITGRKGGLKGGAKGGKARSAKLTPEQRSEIARRAAKARWAR